MVKTLSDEANDAVASHAGTAVAGTDVQVPQTLHDAMTLYAHHVSGDLGPDETEFVEGQLFDPRSLLSQARDRWNGVDKELGAWAQEQSLERWRKSESMLGQAETDAMGPAERLVAVFEKHWNSELPADDEVDTHASEDERDETRRVVGH